MSDKNDMGSYILNIFNLENVGKYFLKIEVKLHSNFEQLITKLEYENTVLRKECQLNGLNKEENNSLTTPYNNDIENSSKITTKPLKKQKSQNSLHSSNIFIHEDNKDLDASDDSVEEYIPVPSTSAILIEYTPTYNPGKNCSEIEMNEIQSQYSPTYVTSEKSSFDAASYRPSNRKPVVREESKKLNSKKHRRHEKSAELFGSSDDDECTLADKVSSSSQHKQRKVDSSPKKESKLRREGSKSKKNSPDTQNSPNGLTKIDDITIRNLMNESIDDILATFSEHKAHLSELYRKQVKDAKRNYKSQDIPALAVHDLLTEPQLHGMIEFLDENLVKNPDNYPNHSDVLFESILPEWAFEIFCKKFECSRADALERLVLQASVAVHQSDSELHF